jgi:hypothetical protein
MLIASCSTNAPETIISPSKRYALKVQVSKNKKDPVNYNCVMITLYNGSKKKIDSVKTGATNDEKWAVGWYPGRDTIILNSADIGVYAFCLSDDKKAIKQIGTTADLINEGRAIFDKKYKKPD